MRSVEENFAKELLEWFEQNKRDFPWRKEKKPYTILIAEKLLQQTSYGHVLKVYKEFIQKYPDIDTLSRASEKELKELITPLGFHRQRSKQLISIGKIIKKEFEGEIPQKTEELVKLPGVGKYIANAVACFAYGKHTPIIDVNVRRVVGRAFPWGKQKDSQLFDYLEEMMPEGKSKEFNWGIIDFSSKVCSRKPKCQICFFKGLCAFYNKVSEKN